MTELPSDQTTLCQVPNPAETSEAARLRIVFDTNVLVAAARSRQGASFAIVSSIPSPDFEPCLSVGLFNEWQDVLTRRETCRRAVVPTMRWGSFVTSLASHICRKSTICGGHSCPMQTTTWFWSLHSLPDVGIYSLITFRIFALWNGSAFPRSRRATFCV